MRAKWVLLVDPRELALGVRAFALWVRGYDVLQAGSLRQALRLAKSVDMVVLEGFDAKAMHKAVLAVKAACDLPVLVAGMRGSGVELGLPDGLAGEQLGEIVEQMKFLMVKKRGPKWAGCVREPLRQQRERVKKEAILKAVRSERAERKRKFVAPK